jgi:hypothetical protein
MTRYLMMAVVLFGSMACAQAGQNRRERARDRQDLRQDQRQLADDRLDAARAAQLLADYDSAAAAGDVGRLGGLDAAFNQYLAREITESKVESAQARQEVREDKRELRSDKREVRQDLAYGRRPGVVRDDARDQRRDQVNLADDRADAASERLSRARLTDIQVQLNGLAGRFDTAAITHKRSLYGEVLSAAFHELARDKAERREDRRELREDRRETGEDRRDPL